MSTPSHASVRLFGGALVASALLACADGGRPAGPIPAQDDPLRPIARADSATVEWGADAWIAVLTNDTDPSGQALTLDHVSTPDHGVAEGFPGNRIGYAAHDYGFAGVDSFTYVVRNAAGKVDSAFVFITVTAPGMPAPPTKSDSGGAWGGSSARINVAKNLGKSGGTPLWLHSIVSAGHGSARFVDDSLEYTASRAFTGLDTVIYRVSNNWGATDTRLALFASKNPIPGYEPSALTVVPIVGPPDVILTLNALNTVRGVAGYATTSTGETRAFRWTNGLYEDLGLVQGMSTRGTAINDASVVGGSYGNPFSPYPALWQGTTLVESIAAAGRGSVRGIMNDGTALVSQVYAAPSPGFFLWRDGVEIRRYSGWVDAFAINQHGDVLCQGISTYNVACVYDASGIRSFGGYGRWSEPIAINNRGEVIYRAEGAPTSGTAHLWFRNASSARILIGDLYPEGALLANPKSLADNGTILGASLVAGAYEFALFTLSGRFALNDLVSDKSWRITGVVQMASNGDILATAANVATGYSGPVLLTR